jgi:hypothetical protein
MALDTLTQVLGVDCCWIQTISDRKHKKLHLEAERGFSPEIEQEISTMDLSHKFSEQIIGLGHQVILPDLSHDGLYGIPSFRNTGYRWLVAVPLMTYRVHGILGTASRNRKLFKKETAELIMTIAGIIAASLSKANLARHAPVEKPSVAPPPEFKPELKTPEKKAIIEPAPEIIKEPNTVDIKPATEPALEIKENPKAPDKKAVIKPAPEFIKELRNVDIKPATEPASEIKEKLKTPEKKPEAPINTKPAAIPPPAKPARRPDGAFHSHARKMESFRKSHR